MQTPAVGAILPQLAQLVPEDKLMKVNGTNGSIQALGMLVAPMISGALLTVSSLKFIFFIDVITAAIAVLTLLLFLPIPTHDKAIEKPSTSYYDDLKQGFMYIKNHHFIKKFFCFLLFSLFWLHLLPF